MVSNRAPGANLHPVHGDAPRTCRHSRARAVRVRRDHTGGCFDADAVRACRSWSSADPGYPGVGVGRAVDFDATAPGGAYAAATHLADTSSADAAAAHFAASDVAGVTSADAAATHLHDVTGARRTDAGTARVADV